MKIAELRLSRYGSFKDETLVFCPPGALHVVYGDNEAGKSTALRAIRALLFGIASRGNQTDTHRFKLGELSIGATLETSEGTLVIERRRGKAGLLDETGESLEEAVLIAALGGVDAETHELMFSLDHDSLRKGGEALLAGKGDAARALFQAHTGHGKFLRAVEQLASERDDIFTDRGRIKPLNTAIRAYFDAERAVREQELSQPTYEKQLEAIRESREDRDRLAKRREELERERARLGVVVRVRGLVAERSRIVATREKLGGAPAFALAEIETWNDAISTKKRAEEACEKLRPALFRAERELAALGFSKELVCAKDRISALERRLGVARDALAHRESLVGELRDATTRLATLEARAPRAFVPCDEAALAEGLSVSEDLHTERRALHELTTRLDAAESQRDRSAAALTVLRETAVTDGSPEAHGEATLRTLVDQLASELRDGRILEREGERAERDRRELSRIRKELGVSDERDQVPDAATVSAWTSQLVRLGDEKRRLETERVAIERREALANAELARIEREGSVPREEDLIALRAERDTRISELAKEPEAPSRPAALAAAKKAVAQADDLADRMRRESELVATFARASTELDVAVREREVLKLALARRDDARDILAAAITREAHFLVVTTDEDALEIEGRVNKMRRAVLLFDAIETHRSESGAAATRIIRTTRELEAELASKAEAPLSMPFLGEAVERGARVLAEATREMERRTQGKARAIRHAEELRRLEADCAALASDADRLAASVARAKRNVGASVAKVPFLAPRTEDALEVVLAHARDVLALSRESARLRAEIDKAERGITTFETDVNEIATELSFTFTGDASTLAETLLQSLGRDIDASRRAEQAEAVVTSAAGALATHEDELRRAGDTLKTALCAAKVGSAAELTRIAETVLASHALENELTVVEERIVALGDGRSLVDLVQLAHALSDIDVSSRGTRVEEELEETEQRMSSLDRSIGGQEAGLPKFLVSGALASATLAESELEKLRELTLEYARRLVFTMVARGAMETFRAGRAERIVLRAGELLSVVTNGSLAGFTTTTEDDDVVRLAAVRGDGRAAGMSELSDGTRDAVFFALRVACLESLAETRALPPVVFDDALVHFDDDRSRAALRVLGDLSSRMQVLFFTHHARMVELATEAIREGHVVVHRLERRDTPSREAAPAAN